jgi:Polyketide cyclase / dehydrase and lipid transport
MAPIVRSIEIARRPEDVFSYAPDFSRFPEWQEGVVSVRPQAEGPPGVGSSAVVTRRVGPRTAVVVAIRSRSSSGWAKTNPRNAPYAGRHTGQILRSTEQEVRLPFRASKRLEEDKDVGDLCYAECEPLVARRDTPHLTLSECSVPLRRLRH